MYDTYKGKAWVATLTFQREYYFSLVYKKIEALCPDRWRSGKVIHSSRHDVEMHGSFTCILWRLASASGAFNSIY